MGYLFPYLLYYAIKKYQVSLCLTSILYCNSGVSQAMDLQQCNERGLSTREKILVIFIVLKEELKTWFVSQVVSSNFTYITVNLKTPFLQISLSNRNKHIIHITKKPPSVQTKLYQHYILISLQWPSENLKKSHPYKNPTTTWHLFIEITQTVNSVPNSGSQDQSSFGLP